MGLFDRIRDAMDGDDDADPEWASPSQPNDDDADPDPDTHTEILATYYEDVSPDQAATIADVFAKTLTGDGGYSTDRLVAAVADRAGIESGLAERIVLTEIASVENLDVERKFANRPLADEAVFKWSGPADGETHPICEEVKATVDERGGTVPLGELQRLLRETARKYEEEGGTPERMDHWVAHEACRYRLIRHIEL